MPYKIAVATSDGVNIDRTFGSAEYFTIYEVNDKNFTLAERIFHESQEVSSENCENGCGSGCGNGCGNGGQHSEKVDLISDCRCVVCTKIGFPIRKQLEKLAISVFDVNCSVDESLQKITSYYSRIDNHKSLKNLMGTSKNLQF